MTYESRLNLNYTFGTLNAAASSSDTTLSSPDFGVLPPTLSTASYVPITLQDPGLKVYEIVWANAHAAGASTVTVVRGKEASAARAWPAGTLWTVTPTLRDGVLPVATRSALPTDPHGGLRCYLQDEQLIVELIQGVGWVSTVAGIGYRATTKLAADASTVSFTGIPAALKQVTLSWRARESWNDYYAEVWVRINNDASVNYFHNWQNQIGFSGPVVVGGRQGATVAILGICAGSSTAATIFGSGEATIPGWDNTTGKGLNILMRSHMYDTTTTNYLSYGSSLYWGDPPYTSLVFYGSGPFRAGSTFTVYGWA